MGVHAVCITEIWVFSSLRNQERGGFIHPAPTLQMVIDDSGKSGERGAIYGQECSPSGYYIHMIGYKPCFCPQEFFMASNLIAAKD